MYFSQLSALIPDGADHFLRRDSSPCLKVLPCPVKCGLCPVNAEQELRCLAYWPNPYLLGFGLLEKLGPFYWPSAQMQAHLCFVQFSVPRGFAIKGQWIMAKD